MKSQSKKNKDVQCFFHRSKLALNSIWFPWFFKLAKRKKKMVLIGICVTDMSDGGAVKGLKVKIVLNESILSEKETNTI